MSHRKNILRIAGVIIFAATVACPALPGGLQFEKSEFAARRQKLMDKIGDGIAIILGSQSEKQTNDFYYLTGCEVPNAILVIDRKKRESVIFFTLSERAARESGLSLDLVRKPVETTGIEKWYPAERLDSYLTQRFYSHLYRQKAEREAEVETIYSPFKPPALWANSAVIYGRLPGIAGMDVSPGSSSLSSIFSELFPRLKSRIAQS